MVLEDHVVVPSALYGEIVGVEEWVAACNVDFALFLLFGRTFRFLSNVNTSLVVMEQHAYLFGLGFGALLLDLLQFTHQRGSLVLFIIPREGQPDILLYMFCATYSSSLLSLLSLLSSASTSLYFSSISIRRLF